MERVLLLTLLLVLIVLNPILMVYGSTSDNWSISGLKYRSLILVETPGLNYSVNNLPIPLIVDNSIIDFSKTSPSGDDIVVTSLNGEIIPSQVEYWNVSEKRGLLWIKPPVYNGSIKLYVYYGVIGEGLTQLNNSDPWGNYYLTLLFNNREIYYIKEKPYLRDESRGEHIAKIIGPGYKLINAPTGQALYLDGENAWVMITNTSFYNWSSITIEALLHFYDEQARYGRHRDLSYGNYITAPFASIYILYGENKTRPNITLYFTTWRLGVGIQEYTVNLTDYRGKWVYLVLTYNNISREYNVYVNGEKKYSTTIPLDEMTILDVNPRKWDPYGTRYISLGLGANNLGFERSRVAYDFVRILKDKVLDEKWVKAEYLALTNTSIELIRMEENHGGQSLITGVPKTLIFGILLVLIVSIAYMTYSKRRS